MSSSQTIFPADYSVTGIRSLTEEDTLAVITGSCPPPSNSSSTATPGLIYRGPVIPKPSPTCSWNPADSTGCLCVLPQIDGQTPVTAVFYGPDTPIFTPSMGAENIRVVGSYRLTTTGYDHGVKYQGPLTVGGLENHANWERIVMDPNKVNGTVANTILHSTMGDLIVGNYDVEGKIGSGNAFIYRISTGECFDLKTLLQLDSAQLITAYGIWKNDITPAKNGTAYTIAGGLWEPGDHALNVGFLVDVDAAPKTPTTSHLTTFTDHNVNALVTHFEGITRYGSQDTKYGPAQYSLAATGDKTDVNRGAAFAIVTRDPVNGSFVPEAHWVQVPKPAGASFITGNTVLQKNLYGIYPAGGNTFDSYVAEM